LDGLSLGFETYLLQDVTRAVNLNPEDGKLALEEMEGKGVKLIESKELID
jgi:nicotinamidase/pyrazinamidase